ncbi:MAG: nucleotidyl transferase AbiEii/AbiGii toxin family protein [Patescibacteria group bacterium]
MHQEVLSDKQKIIFSKLNNFNDFYLAGGTALALEIGHRISVDFDLFSEESISEKLLTKVKNVFSGENVSISVNNFDELTIFIDGVKVTFLKYPFPVLFDFIDFDGVKLLNTKEIASTKAYTIGRRGSYKDYVDLYFILYENHIFLNEILEISEKKFKNEFNGRLFLEQLVYLDDIEDLDVIFLKNKIDKKTIIEFFVNEIKKVKI